MRGVGEKYLIEFHLPRSHFYRLLPRLKRSARGWSRTLRTQITKFACLYCCNPNNMVGLAKSVQMLIRKANNMGGWGKIFKNP